MPEEQKKDIWDKASAVSGLTASILIPLVVAIVGNSYSAAIKDSENRVKYTELAISILKEKPSPDNGQIRSWAVQVIDRYSGVPLSGKAREQLLNSTILSGASFNESLLEGASFRKANLKESSFNKALLDDGNFSEASLRGAIFDNADLRGADLSRAIIDQTTRLPKGGL